MKTKIKSAGFNNGAPWAAVMDDKKTPLHFGSIPDCIAYSELVSDEATIDLQSFVNRMIGVREQGALVTRVRYELPFQYRDEIEKTIDAIVAYSFPPAGWAEKMKAELLKPLD